MSEPRNILITGAGGYIGHQLVERLHGNRTGIGEIVAVDLRLPPDGARLPGVTYVGGDVRDASIGDILSERHIDVVVHLACIVSPTHEMTREFLHSVDVGGTENVLAACAAAGVDKIIVTSSGAAYGYHVDNPEWLSEEDPLRGNREFAYSDHKREVEEILSRYRREHPRLRQLVLRLCTVVGAHTHNQITAMFEQPVVIGVTGASTPFVFVWDQDVVECLEWGIRGDRDGIFNVAGDGTMTMAEIAGRLGKPYIPLPAWLLRGGLSVLHAVGLSPYGPEQVEFLAYRPVLANRKLKEEFGFTPSCTSSQAFERYVAGHHDG